MNSTRKRAGFHTTTIYRFRRPSVVKIAQQKLSFLIASMSLFAFVIGNMVGQHGWYAFWKTVMGKEDTMLAFVGTVSPIAKIPDYTLWSQYGGNKRDHTYNEAPSSVLRDIPVYDQRALTNGTDPRGMQVYSTLWMGGYNSPSGSHPGVDIDAPRGTPVVAIANGIVTKTSMQTNGFGRHVLLKHPNVPDSKSSTGGTMTLYSTYAHLDTILVQEGEVVHKGQLIGTVGNTGTVFGATGYHLYFQVEKDTAPFHPYWSFTQSEASTLGMTFAQAVNSTAFQERIVDYTINPMIFVQSYSQYISPTVVADRSSLVPTNSVAPSAPQPQTQRQSIAELASLRRRTRLASSSASLRAEELARTTTVVADISTDAPLPVVTDSTLPVEGGTSADVSRLTIEHSGFLSRSWQKVRLSALDRDGDLVRNPSFPGKLYVIPEFGQAEIRPSELTPADFINGVATVNVLARGPKTTFISTRGAFSITSAPMISGR